MEKGPLSLKKILGKSPLEFGREDFLKLIKEKDIRRLTFHYTALDGKLKELSFPIADSAEADMILAEGERADGSSLYNGILEAEESDIYVVPDYRTAFINPFDMESLDFICRFIDKDGKPASFALDNVLSNAVKLFEQTSGLSLSALGELEFYLLYARENNLYSLDRQGGYHESSPFIKKGRVIKEIAEIMNNITGAVKYAHSERGSIPVLESEMEEIAGKTVEQLELEFKTRPVEETADILTLARWVIRNVAYRHGCLATFCPKLEEGIAGNGLHFHLELNKQGENIMIASDGNLSEEALKLIGGLCKFAGVLTAFGNMTAASYYRLVPDQEAPTKIYWSDLNRLALIRVPLNWKKEVSLASLINPTAEKKAGESRIKQTVELRSPDGSALIHLLLAGIVMTAVWAFETKNSIEEAYKHYVSIQDKQDESRLKSFPSLPSGCDSSAELLLENRSIFEKKGVFPSGIIDYIVSILKSEESEMLSGVSSDIKKILHRDIHRH